MCGYTLSHIQLFVTPWIVILQAPLSLGFSRKEQWSGLPFPTPRYPPNPEIEPESPESSTLAGVSYICTTYEAQITYHSDSLILSNSCASISSAISSIHLVMVLAERGTHATF